MPRIFIFIALTIAAFIFLLFLFPRILYFVTLIYYVLKQKYKKNKRNKNYSLKNLKEISSEKIKI